MFKELLKDVEGLQLMADLSLIIFFVAFVLIVIWVMLLDKKFTNYMSKLPLENDKNIDNK